MIYNEYMATKLVKPNDPSLDTKLPAFPRAEAHRMRRAARSYMDILLPEAVKVLQDALLSEDMDDRKWAFDRISKYSLVGKSNEELDPEEAVVVDMKADDSLKELEESTANGTGEDEPE